MTQREFTGRHVAMIFFGAFGIIISVNLFLAFSAVSTFPGLEVKNSYVASQEFDTRRDAQTALGWDVGAEHSDGMVILSINDKAGNPVELASLEAVLGRATHVKDDRVPAFSFNGSAYVAPEDLAGGNWNIRMKATALDGTEFIQRVVLYVKG